VLSLAERRANIRFKKVTMASSLPCLDAIQCSL
jgi:hypothetical protein